MITLTQRPNYQLYRFFLWADIVEILALVNKDKSCSKRQFLDRLFATTKDIDNKILEELEPSSLGSEYSRVSVATAEDREKFLNDIFAILDYRSSLYGAKYPFSISSDVLNVIEGHPNTLLYSYLLLSSHTRVIESKSSRSLLTSDFEKFCYEVLNRYLGDRATVHVFGAGTARDTLFERDNTTLREKYQTLASTYHGRFIGDPDDPSLSQTSGDKGLDLVANFSFSDKLNSRIVIYGQCKCSDEWSDKLFEASDESLNEIIRFKSKPVSLMFTPFCFRAATGNWAEDSLVRSTVLFDRFRLVEFVNFEVPSVLTKSNDFLNEFLKFSESII